MYRRRNLTLATSNCSQNSSLFHNSSAKIPQWYFAMAWFTTHSGKLRKTIAGVLAGLLLLVLVLLGAAYSRRRAAELRTRDWIVKVLEERFQSEVQLKDLHVSAFPSMEVSGEGLTIRYRSRPDVPPMIHVEKFSFELGWWSIFQAPHRVRHVHVQRMVITVPPKQKVQPSPFKPKELPAASASEIECDDATLLIIPAKPGAEPLDWEIHNLVLTDVEPNKPFRFHGTLTNAKPKGEIATKGSFGPWNLDDPGATPVSGSYGFAQADLGPFPGIAGILSSRGKFEGELDQLEVNGETTTPDFSLDKIGKPVPLHTDFSATVDGTNGDTLLHPVRAILGQSVIVANGGVVAVPGRGHHIKLDVTTPKARIEDVLQLAINSDKPFLRGQVVINAKLSLPPGKEKVLNKLGLTGSFAVIDARWSSSEMREKLESFSRRAEGQPENEDAGSAVTNLHGAFVLQGSVIHFSELSFSVPGAQVELAGTYEIETQKIDMQGHLKMQAKLSQTMTGAKSFFTKMIDPLFSKNGAGTELPITITGTQENPVMGVTAFHKRFEKRMGSPAARSGSGFFSN